jgi:hypothetical protein
MESVFEMATNVPFYFFYFILLISMIFLLIAKLGQPAKEGILAIRIGESIILWSNIKILIPLPFCNHISQLPFPSRIIRYALCAVRHRAINPQGVDRPPPQTVSLVTS